MIKYIRKINLHLYKILFISIIISLLSCNSTTGVDTSTYGLIIPGKSVNGIKLWDTKANVEAILGQPSSIGWADGSNRSWRTYIYIANPEEEYSNENKVIDIGFLQNDTDFDTVDVISVGQSYKGKTEFGIGIGSSLEMVYQIYGLPVESTYKSYSNSNNEIYCIKNKWFEILYKDSLITRMSMGNYKPYPVFTYCK